MALKRHYYDNGKEQRKLVTGKMISATEKRDWFYQSGKPAVKYVYVTGGSINGADTAYYESGKLQSLGAYKNNLEEGKWTEYYDNDANNIKRRRRIY